jgi:hypothetical protein
MLVIPAFSWGRKIMNSSLGYIVRPYLNKTKQQQQKPQ